MICLFIADIAQPGYLKFWQPDVTELSTIDVRLPSLQFNNDTATVSPSETSTCTSPENDLEAILRARFGCHNATSD